MKKPRKKKKSRDSDEEFIEQLQKDIRELKSLNRSLLRRIKKLDRNFEENLEEEPDVEYVPIKSSLPKCPKCKEGELSTVLIESLGKKYLKCSLFGCRYRTVTEKV